MTRRFGAEATTYLAEPLLAGIHAGDVDRLSVRALFPRFVEAEAKHGSLLRAFRRQPAAHAVARRRLQIAARRLERHGSRARRDPARGIDSRADACRLESRRTATASASRPAPAIDSTRARSSSPRRRLPRRRSFGTLSPALSQLCGEIPYASAATIALAFRRDAVAHPLNGSGFVVPRVENTGIMAGSWLSSKWPNRAPADRVLLRAFVGGARDPARSSKSDAELVATVDDGASAAARHRRRTAADARVSLGARKRAARGRSPRSARADRDGAYDASPDCISPAAAIAASAFPTASPTAAQLRKRCAHGSLRPFRHSGNRSARLLDRRLPRANARPRRRCRPISRSCSSRSKPPTRICWRCPRRTAASCA